MNEDWKLEFFNVWQRGIAAWQAGRQSPYHLFAPADLAFLAGIGCSAQELFDFVDDAQSYRDVDFAMVLAVTAIRREYFLEVMQGNETGRVIPIYKLPAKTDRVDGIAWLPRLIAKARLKLRGEMDPYLMYGCAGDRPFLRKHDLTLAQFLQIVRENFDDDRAIIEAFKRASSGEDPEQAPGAASTKNGAASAAHAGPSPTD